MLDQIEHHPDGLALLTFIGKSDGDLVPQAQILFSKMPGDWDIRVDLGFAAKVNEAGLSTKL